MVHYSYELFSGKIVRELVVRGNKRLVLCELQFLDEHENFLAPTKRSLVALSTDSDSVPAKLVREPEDWLEDEATDSERQQVQEWIDASDTPRYDFYDESHAYKTLVDE